MRELKRRDTGTREAASPADPVRSSPPPGAGEQPKSPATDPFRAIVAAHYQAVYRYAYRLCGGEADAEDLTQQTFLIAQHKLHQVRDVTKLQAWLFAVVRSCFRKSLRRQRPVAAVNLELDVDEVPEHRPHASGLDQEDLRRALQDLPDEFRLIVLMFYFEELSYAEIARRLDLPIGTVMSRLSRAKGRLRQAFAEPPSPPPPPRSFVRPERSP